MHQQSWMHAIQLLEVNTAKLVPLQSSGERQLALPADDN